MLTSPVVIHARVKVLANDGKRCLNFDRLRVSLLAELVHTTNLDSFVLTHRYELVARWYLRIHDWVEVE